MNFLFPILAIICESVGKTIDKLNFRRNRVTSQQLMLLAFSGMSVCLVSFIVATRQPVPDFSLAAIGLLAVIAIVSFGGNVFDNLSLKADDLSLREPLVDFEPIAAGLVGYLFFPAERKPAFLLAFVLCAFIVYWGSHRRKLRASQRKGLVYLLVAVALYGLLPSIYQLTLVRLSPAYISLVRVVAVLVLSLIFFRPARRTKFTSGRVAYGLTSSIVYAAEAVVNLYAIKVLGVVLTMLLLSLGPALRYYAGYFVLKEKVRSGEMFASSLLVVVITVALLK